MIVLQNVQLWLYTQIWYWNSSKRDGQTVSNGSTKPLMILRSWRSTIIRAQSIAVRLESNQVLEIVILHFILVKVKWGSEKASQYSEGRSWRTAAVPAKNINQGMMEYRVQESKGRDSIGRNLAWIGLEMWSIPAMSSEAEHIFSRSVPPQLPC